MRRILFLLMLMCSVSTWAQDVIVKRDGTAVICRIINVSSLEIVYKKWTNLQGPNLVMSIADAASITYENGEKKVFENATQSSPIAPIVQNNSGQQTVSDDMLLKMYGKPELTPQEMYKKAKKLKIAGWVTGCAMVAGGGLMIVASVTFAQERGRYCNHALLFPGIGIAGGGLITSSACLIRAHNLNKKASQYSVQSAPIYQQEFHLKNGTTLSPSINMLKDNTRHNPTLGLGLTYNF